MKFRVCQSIDQVRQAALLLAEDVDWRVMGSLSHMSVKGRKEVRQYTTETSLFEHYDRSVSAMDGPRLHPCNGVQSNKRCWNNVRRGTRRFGGRSYRLFAFPA